MQGNPQRTLFPDAATCLRRAGLALFLLPAMPAAHAAGLGAYEVQSGLGQPLRLAMQITARPDEAIDIACFRIHPFTISSDGLPQLTTAQLTLDKRGDQQRLIVSSARPILDPIVRVSIDIGCDTALRRDLTLLLDPVPAIETQAVAAAPPVPAGRPITEAAPPAMTASAEESMRAGTAGGAGTSGGAETGAGRSPSVAAGRAARQDGTAAAAGGARQPRRPRVLDAAEPQAAAQPRPRPSRPAATPPRDRLSVSTAGPPLKTYVGAPITPRLMLSTTLADRSEQPPLPESALSILRQKQARLKAAPSEEDIPSLEAELVVLQKRTAEMRGQLDAVMAQMASLRESSGSPGAGSSPATQPTATGSAGAATPARALPPESPGSQWNWRDPRLLMIVPLGVVVLLLLVVFAIWQRRERAQARRAPRWNRAPYVPATAPQDPPPRAYFGTDREIERMERAAPSADSPPIPDSYAFTSFTTGSAARELGVSDLAQATEKASVFVTLGRPEQAIDVLRDHIDHEPRPSPMAWLMLLDLYRQTGRRDEFQDVAGRFHLEFNAETPAWDQASPQHDEGLATFPHLVRRVRDGWPGPAARAYIEELLYDNRGGSRVGFSLPAFRDLLLLYSIVDDYLAALEEPLKIDPGTGAVMPPAPPSPPPHLARAWATGTAGAAAPAVEPAMHLDMGRLSDSSNRSCLETSYPIITGAVLERWGKPGAGEYLSQLIRSTNDSRGPDLSNEAMAELIMLHDVALELEPSGSGAAFG